MYCATDCNSPLLDSTKNPDAPSTKEAKPTKGAKGMKMCTRLIGKDTCCSTASFADLKSKFGKRKKTFEGKRSKEMGALEKVNKTVTDYNTLDMQTA